MIANVRMCLTIPTPIGLDWWIRRALKFTQELAQRGAVGLRSFFERAKARKGAAYAGGLMRQEDSTHLWAGSLENLSSRKIG